MPRGRRIPRRVASRPLLALFAALALAPATLAAGDGPKVRAVALDRPPVEGAFVSLTATACEIAGATPALPVDGLRELRFASDSEATPAPGKGVALRVFLRGDETIRGVFQSGDADGIEVRPYDLPSLRLPFESIRRIESEVPSRGPCDEPARERPAREKTDVAYTRSGDSFPGTVVGASEKGLTLENAEKKTSTVAWDDLLVAHLQGQDPPPPTGLVAEVETLHGSRLPATSVTGDAATGLKVVTRAKIALTVPLASVRAIRWTGGRFVYASDLPYQAKWTGYYGDETSALETPWFIARSDRTFGGCPLQVARTRYRHGIWVNAKSEVTIPLAKMFTSFEAGFGVDDALDEKLGTKGDVTARVLLDGKPVWTSGGSVKAGEAARAVGPIDVTGADSLVLEVDWGGGQNEMDRADWCDPLLVRAKP